LLLGGVVAILLVMPPASAVDARGTEAWETAQASQVMDRARDWLGGAKLLDGIRALQFQRSTQSIRLLFPDLYQTEQAASNGGIKVSFDGSQLWMLIPGMPARTTGATAADTARGRRRMAVYAMTYLVRTVPSFPVAARVSRGACAGIPGDCIALAGDTGPSFHMVFSTQDGRPLAVIEAAPPQPDGTPAFQSISELSDYRMVDGLRFPFKETTKRRDLATGDVSVISHWINASVVVNPPLRKEDFKKPVD
jgi:hypothetical protein